MEFFGNSTFVPSNTSESTSASSTFFSSSEATSWSQPIENGSTTWIFTSTGGPCTTDTPKYVGYIALLVTSVLFGTNLLPAKKFDTGDGMFFQFMQCSAICMFGIFFNWAIGTPEFEPLAMLGGVMWASGNMCCVLVIRSIGLGIGLVMWSLQGLILGWASGRFGWFGATPAVPSIEWLQYLGVALCAVRGVMSMFIQSETGEPTSSDLSVLVNNDELGNNYDDIGTLPRSNSGTQRVGLERVVNGNSQGEAGHISPPADVKKGDFLSRMSPTHRRILGFALAIFAGTMFGLQFAPVTYAKAGKSCVHDWNYSFAFYCGVFAASLIYTVIYSVVMRNKPFINPQLFLGGFASGLMWVIAQTSWFVANETLNQSISFPIINTLPPLIAIFFSVVVFHEIRGRQNMILLAITIVLGIGSVLMVAFSA